MDHGLARQEWLDERSPAVIMMMVMMLEMIAMMMRQLTKQKRKEERASTGVYGLTKPSQPGYSNLGRSF